MRTTVDLPPDLHNVLRSLAASNRRSFSQTAVDLIWRGLDAQAGGPSDPAEQSVSPVTGLPQVRLPRTVTLEDVRALDDEA
jgi:hypothetical protein